MDKQAKVSAEDQAQSFQMTRGTDAQGRTILIFPDLFTVPGQDGDHYPAQWRAAQPQDPTNAPILEVTFFAPPPPKTA